MPTPLDGPLPKVVLKIINLLGKPVTYIEYSAAAYNKTTGKSTREPTEHSVKGAFDEISHKLVDGTLVKWTDAVLYIPAKDLPFTPTTTGRIRDDGREYTIIKADPIRSGELEAAWRLVVRG